MDVGPGCSFALMNSGDDRGGGLPAAFLLDAFRPAYRGIGWRFPVYRGEG